MSDLNLHYLYTVQLTQVDEKSVVDLPIIGTSDDEVDEDMVTPQMEEMTPSASAMGSSAPISSVAPSSLAASGGGVDAAGGREATDGEGDIIEEDGLEKDSLEVDGEDSISQSKVNLRK